MMKKHFALLCAVLSCVAGHSAEVVIEGIAPAAARPVRPAVTPAATAPAAPAAATAAKPTDTLELQGGDTLKGEFVGIEPETGVRWRHEAIREVISVIPDKIRTIRLQRGRATESKPANARVLLANGDKLAGNLAGLTDKELTLETWYAGTLKIPRASLRSLAIESGRGELIYAGPTGMDGWSASGMNRNIAIQEFGGFADVAVAELVARRVVAGGAAGEGGGQSAWTFKDDAFQSVSSGTLGRDLKLPPTSRIDFEAEWSGYPQFTVYFYADAVDKTYGMNSWALMFSSRNIYLRRYTAPGSTRSIGSVVTDSPMMSGGNTKARVSIRTDEKNKAISLYVDDALVRKWTDVGEHQKLGTGLMFYQQGNNLVRISNLQVTRWDGQADDSTAAAADKEDLLVLKNQDKISGQLVGIQNQQVEFKASFNNLQIPLDRLSQVQLAGGKPADTAAPGTVRLNFWDASRVTLKLEKWTAQAVEGESLVFGRATFKPGAFSSLVFTPAAESKR